MVGSRSRKYLVYAVGEVFLVIVGILIALQVDNWNEERIEQQQIQEFAQELIEDYMFDRDLILDAMKVADEIIDSSYLVDDEAMVVLREIYREPYSFPPTKLYELYKDTELQLLTDDKNRLRVLVNKYDRLSGIRVRTDAELPRLLENARELSALLKDEYQE